MLGEVWKGEKASHNVVRDVSHLGIHQGWTLQWSLGRAGQCVSSEEEGDRVAKKNS